MQPVFGWVLDLTWDGVLRDGVRTVDEALEMLTGETAGVREASGAFPADSIHRRVDDRLRRLAEAQVGFNGADKAKTRRNGKAGKGRGGRTSGGR